MSAYDAALAAVLDHGADLAAWLAAWERRAEPDGHARRGAGHAVTAIDVMLGELYGIRARLVAEIRAADNASAARADTLLTDLRPAQ